ncbi:NERD domain-containing protein [Pseudomonas sp. IzPS59]|uniref:NERD domain-containing protein n=1 Tax=Pseudomonas sp. IzPS59 TaxID=2774459 RepID=UPI0017889918|nr:NERD domain-containing protein [Pseudomonas sp. IzPS59]
MLLSTIALYIGAPIEEESERVVLRALLAILEERAVPATVFANLHIGGRQLDFVIGTDQLTLVLEAKGVLHPLRGGYNSDWTALTRLGRWKPYRNAYLQALQAKNVLRDAMRAHDPLLSGYPDACVMFTPSLPNGSDLPASNHKVSLNDLDELSALIDQNSTLRWSPDRWHHFAEMHGLQRITNAESAFDTHLLDAERSLHRYTSAFAATYGPMAARYVSDIYDQDGQGCELGDIEVALLRERSDLLIRGPSGCGKTLLSLCIANRVVAGGIVPVLIDCKSFNGQLAASLDSEAALLDLRSAAALIAAARRMSRPIAVFVDGYNECQETSRVQLTRALRAASVKYNALIVITSQIDIERPDLLQLRHVSVGRPGNELKAKIASINPSSDASLIPLLEAATTGIEADLVGQIGREIPQSSSRFALFDYFVRRKLGDSATEGIRLLCAIAKRLVDRMTYSLSIREVDRLLAELDLPASTLRQVHRSGVLNLRGDRVSLCHEMYRSVFATEALVRQAGFDDGAILAALTVPKYDDLRTFLIGAIEDESLLATILSKVSDSKLLEACLLGECGSAARLLITDVVAALPARLTEEASRLRFDISAERLWKVAINPDSLTTWSDRDFALLSVLAAGMAEGRWIKEVLGAVKRMDTTLAAEFRRLHSEAAEKKINIRSGLFAVTYVFVSERVGLTRIASDLHSGALTLRRASTSTLAASLELAWRDVASPGQLYFILALSRLAYEVRDTFAQYVLPYLQQERWKSLTYHVHLDLLDYAHTLREVPDHIQQGYVEALQYLLPDLHPWLAQTAIEALSGLGALQEEEDQHVESVRLQIREILSSESAEAPGAAWGFYNAQFDHPFSSAYIQVFEELPAQEQLSLLRLACEGAEGDDFFLSSLIDELARQGDRLAIPYIMRWTQLPSQQSKLPQQAIETFIAAFVALGALANDLPAENLRFGGEPREDALLACGVLYHWLQRRDASFVLEEYQAALALEVLQSSPDVAVGVLYTISRSISDFKGRSVELVRAFPDQTLEMCRAALQSPSIQPGYFDGAFFADHAEALRFAINVIGKYGSVDDLVRLRSLVDDSQSALTALNAIKSIEERRE